MEPAWREEQNPLIHSGQLAVFLRQDFGYLRPFGSIFRVASKVIWAKDLYFRDILLERIVLIYAMHIFVDVPGTAINC